MNVPAITEAVITDLPFPEPNRRQRFVLRFAALAAAVSVLGAAYWFTRPPELVEWESPLINELGHRLRVLVPNGWILDPQRADRTNFVLVPPPTSAPRWLAWILPADE